jgi:hypothetical protein
LLSFLCGPSSRSFPFALIPSSVHFCL